MSDAPAAHFRIREARPGDLSAIVEFNRLLALETESKVLDLEVLSRGVLAALSDADRIRYWVALVPGQIRLAGQAAVTREWSDWRNGWIWWIQSVYVSQQFRRQGIFPRTPIARFAPKPSIARTSSVLRLYVEDANERAHNTYKALGMKPGGYSVYQDLWIERAPRSVSLSGGIGMPTVPATD